MRVKNRAKTRANTPAKTPVEVLRLHPLIRAQLGPVDLRRVRVLEVSEQLVVDLVVENRPGARSRAA